MAKIKDLHPNLSSDLSVFTVKNLSSSADFSGLRHNSSLFCYF